MIWHDTFVWLHLPRTGGTATAAWIREIFKNRATDASSAVGAIAIDDDWLPQKHDNLLTREIRSGITSGTRSIVMNFRTLDEWLLSNFKFAQAAGMNVSIERYLAGEFFSLRMGGWCLADWWLQYFETSRVSHFFRLDRLEQDWRQFLQHTVGLEVPVSHTIVAMNQAPTGEEVMLDLDRESWSLAYERNPRWSRLQTRLTDS